MKYASIKPHNNQDKKKACIIEKMVNFHIKKILENPKFKLRMILGSDFDIKELEEYLKIN